MKIIYNNIYMSRTRQKIDKKTGKPVLYNIDTGQIINNQSFQQGKGFFSSLGSVAKDFATKAATKAIEKGSEQIGSKFGQVPIVGEKIYDKFANKKQKTIKQRHDKGHEIIQLLEQHPDNKKYQNDDKKQSKSTLSDQFDQLLIM